jgi:hypothetical protein
MLATSATTFHSSNTILKNVPGLNDMIKKNPTMINKLTKKFINPIPQETSPEVNIHNNINPRDFLNQMREQQKQYQQNQEPPDIDLDSISEIVTSTNKRKKKNNKNGITINL